MPSQLQLPDGRMHTVGAPVEDPAPEQAVEDAHAALEDGTAEAAEPAITPCVTAFTVYLMSDGEVLVDSVPWGGPEPGRKPTFDEIYHGASVLHQDMLRESWCAPSPGEEGCVTAFTPYYTPDGRWLISADVADPLVVDRAPTNAEIIGGLAVVMRDVQTQEVLGPIVSQFAQALVQSITQSVTQSVIGNMINMSQQAQQALQGAAIAEQLEKDKARRGGR